MKKRVEIHNWDESEFKNKDYENAVQEAMVAKILAHVVKEQSIDVIFFGKDVMEYHCTYFGEKADPKYRVISQGPLNLKPEEKKEEDLYGGQVYPGYDF